MSKDYTANKVEDFKITIIPWATIEPVDEPVEYYAGRLIINAKGRNGSITVPYNRSDNPDAVEYLGAAKSQKWTEKEVYDYFNNLCSPLANKMKAAWLDLINIDPSQ